MDINHLDVYDLYPALLLLLIVTGILGAAFTTGILLGLLRYIILPVLPSLYRRPRRISQEERDLQNITALFNTLPKPHTHIPSTTRKMTKW